MIREWLIYAAIMAAVFLIITRGQSAIGTIIALLASAPLYLAVGYVLAKFGYQRKTFKEARASTRRVEIDEPEAAKPRPKPAPTKRTGGPPGPVRPTGKGRR